MFSAKISCCNLYASFRNLMSTKEVWKMSLLACFGAFEESLISRVFEEELSNQKLKEIFIKTLLERPQISLIMANYIRRIH